VRTMTSFAHVFTQSKLAFARCWQKLDPASLDADDRAVARRHVAESYDVEDVARADLIARPDAWVVKRAMGRVGEEVFVGEILREDGWPQIVETVLALAARGERWVAQRFVRQRPIATPWGNRLVTLGAYVLDGRFAGYFARVTPHSHVSHDALCVPVFALSEA
jgi:hypothetical protein